MTLARRIALLVLILGFQLQTLPARSDVALPLDSFRSQGFTDHCWAYAASHFLEARAQFLTGNSVTLDTENDLRYWVLYGRFMQRYKLKHEMSDYSDSDLASELGDPNELLTAFFEHGHAVHSVKIASKTATYAYPTEVEAAAFIGFQRPQKPEIDAKALVKALDATQDDTAADALIRKALDASSNQITATKTQWLDQTLAETAIPAAMLGADLEKLRADPLVYVDEATPTKTHIWESYLGGKYLIYYVTRGEMVAIAQKSLDQGLPVMAANPDHVWAVTGYHGDVFASADSDYRLYWDSTYTSNTQFALKSAIAAVVPQAANPVLSKEGRSLIEGLMPRLEWRDQSGPLPVRTDKPLFR